MLDVCPGAPRPAALCLAGALTKIRAAQTDLNAVRRYGTCLAFAWPSAGASPERGAPLPPESSHGLCLLSRVPVLDTARRLLCVLHELLCQRLHPGDFRTPDGFTKAAARIVLEAPCWSPETDVRFPPAHRGIYSM